MAKELTTIRDAYTYFSDLHGSERPIWDRDQMQAWLFDHDYTAPYTKEQIEAAVDAEMAE